MRSIRSTQSERSVRTGAETRDLTAGPANGYGSWSTLFMADLFEQFVQQVNSIKQLEISSNFLHVEIASPRTHQAENKSSITIAFPSIHQRLKFESNQAFRAGSMSICDKRSRSAPASPSNFGRSTYSPHWTQRLR